MKVKDFRTGIEYDTSSLVEIAKAANCLVAMKRCNCNQDTCEICRLRKAIDNLGAK